MWFSGKMFLGLAMGALLVPMVSAPVEADIPDETFEVLGLDRDGDPADLFDALE